MPLQGSAYASALKSIGFPESASAAQAKWEQAWKDFASGCTQAISTGLAYSLAGAFEPKESKSAFFDKLESAGKADIAAFVLKPNNGTTTPPTAPLGYSPADAESKDAPMGDLGDKMASFVKSAMSTGIPPDFSGLGPLS
jgi:hypothetical protein